MKLKPEQIMYVRSMGKALRVTAIFTDAKDANKYMEANRDQGVIAEFKPFIFIANLHDQGAYIRDKFDDPAQVPA